MEMHIAHNNNINCGTPSAIHYADQLHFLLHVIFTALNTLQPTQTQQFIFAMHTCCHFVFQ